MPEVSVIIPTFNRSNLLKKTLRSILNQTYTDYEIVIISNGSTDGTEEVVKSYKDQRIKFIFQNGSGSPASPRNRGIKVAQGKYIAFCDDDDLWLPEKLEKQISFLNGNLNHGLCYTKMKRFDDEKEWVDLKEETNHQINSINLLYKNTIPLSSVVIRKEILENIELFDEDQKISGAEDYELILRLSKITKLFCIQEYLLLYYSGTGRFSDCVSLDSMRTNTKYIIRIYNVYLKVTRKKYFRLHEVICPFFANFFHAFKRICRICERWAHFFIKRMCSVPIKYG